MKIGMYECDVTPPLGGFLWGSYRPKYAESILDELYVKAAVFEDGGEAAAIVCADSCVLPPEAHDAVTDRIFKYTGIKPENVCICANHTHTGAPVFDDPTVDGRADAAYKDVFLRRCADAVTLAWRDRKECELRSGSEKVGGIAFCRDFLINNGKYETRFSGSADIVRARDVPDDTLSVITVLCDGAPCGTITNFACHQCCTVELAHSGDYSSVMSQELKKRFGSGFINLFTVGACGDVNHIDISKSKDENWYSGRYADIGKTLAEKTVEIMENSSPLSGDISVAKEPIEVEKRVLATDEAHKYAAHLLEDKSFMRLRNFLLYDVLNSEKTQTLRLQVIRIGDLGIFAMPGEVFTKVAAKLKEKSPFGRTVVMELCNDYCGYIPDADAFGEDCDLYEASLCFHSCLAPRAGEQITEKMLEMADKIYNKK